MASKDDSVIGTNPLNTAISSTTSTTTTTTTTTPPIEDNEATHRVQKIENQRKLCYAVGCVQLTWGVIGMFIAFSWVSNTLTLATGALSVGAWRTLNDALRFFDRNQPNCCNPSHTKPLCISIIVFTILELITFGAVFPIGLFFIAIANVSATDTEGNTYTVPLGPRAYITYIGLSIVLGAIWPIVSLILSIVQMCFTDSLMSMGQSRIFITPSSSQITVISMPQQQQGMPPMMMMGSGYSNAPNIYQMAQHATQLPPSNPGYGYPQPPPGMMHPYHPQQQQGYPSNYPPPQQGQDGGYPMNNYPQQPMVTSGGPGMMPTPPAYNTVGDPSNNNGGNPYSKN